MTLARHERRRSEDGSLICENGHLRVLVVRDGRSLGVVVQTRGIDMRWGSLAFASSGEDIHATGADGVDQAGFFFTFDPHQVDGVTNGVTLHGKLGDAALAFIVTLDEIGTWCGMRLTVSGAPATCRRLTQQWRLLPDDMPPELCWPPTVIRGESLAFSPAAFVQDGPIFAALVADLTEDDPSLYGLEVSASDPVCFEYGLWDGLPATPVQLAYSIGLDARALPERGFQQVVRLLGSRDELLLPDRCLALPGAGMLPELASPDGAEDWHPFLWEGTPEAMAATVRRKLAEAAAGDWQSLEDGLCWLDRLCLQQCACGTPGASNLGAFGPPEEWHAAAPWMSLLLMRAFTLTGIPEYAARGLAALNALPPAHQAVVLGHLRPIFGDLYALADFEELVSLSGPEVTAALFTPAGLELTVAPDLPRFRLVLDGSDDAYTLSVNNKNLGAFDTATLRAGIDIEVPA